MAGMKYDTLHAPSGGLNRRMDYQSQAPFTTPDCLNYIADDPILGRERGGSRPGFSSYGAAGSGPVRHLGEVRYVDSGVFSTRLVAVAGNSFYWNDSGTTWTQVGSGGEFAERPLQGASFLMKYYLASPDTDNPSLYEFDPTGPTLAKVTGDTGLIDPDGDGEQTYADTSNTPPDPPPHCTLVTAWANRLIMAGDVSNPLSVFMSGQGNAGDWRFGFDIDPGSAINLVTSPTSGALGDAVTALIPHNDKCLIIGMRGGIEILRGDPNFGGSKDPLIQGVGIISPHAWCYDDEGALFFVSSNGLYVMPPGCGSTPFQVSRPKLPRELLGIDPASYYVTLAYDQRFKGLHLCVAPISTGTAQNYFISLKVVRGGTGFGVVNAAFFPQSYGFTPTCLFGIPYGAVAGSGKSPVLMGAANGAMQYWDAAVACEANSHVVYGPFPLAPPGYTGLLKEIDVTTAAGSGDVDVEVRVGNGSEAAYNATAFSTHECNDAGLNYKHRPRAAGAAATIKVKNGENGKAWAIEDIAILREAVGVRRRGE